MKKFLNILKNNYYIIIFAVFLLWMFLFDKNDLVSQYQHMQKLRGLEKDRDYIKQEIKIIEKDINDLSTDKEHLEKFAREKYLMKKENEDVFVIVKE